MSQDVIQGTTADAVAANGHPGTEARVWAARITECWRSSVEGIIRTGRLLVEAKADLVHGEFGAMCARDLPFTQRTAQMLMAVAEDQRISNPKFISFLPASWPTLYELTKLSDDEFTEAVGNKIIRPDMLRGEAELIRPLTHRHTKLPAESESDGWPTTRGPSVPSGGSQPIPSELNANAVSQGATAGETAPNSVPMPSGGLAIAHQRVEPADSLDFFPTPLWATRALIEHVFAHLERKGHCQFQLAWEPACGEGHMAEPLKEYFRKVFASDVHPYGYGDSINDFLKCRDHSADWIITNPPFNTSAAFVLKALDLAGIGVAMFVRLSWLESVGRYECIFRDHPPTLLAIFSERVPLHKGRWEDKGNTMTAYVWLVWIKGAEPRAPFWIPPGCREALTKADDAKRFGKSAAFELPPHDPETGEIREGEAA